MTGATESAVPVPIVLPVGSEYPEYPLHRYFRLHWLSGRIDSDCCCNAAEAKPFP